MKGSILAPYECSLEDENLGMVQGFNSYSWSKCQVAAVQISYNEWFDCNVPAIQSANGIFFIKDFCLSILVVQYSIFFQTLQIQLGSKPHCLPKHFAASKAKFGTFSDIVKKHQIGKYIVFYYNEF